MFDGASNGEEEKVKERFLKEGISPSQLIVRSAKEREQLAEEFCQANLVTMPSRTEGFGLAALEGLSAGLPVLVSGNSFATNDHMVHGGGGGQSHYYSRTGTSKQRQVKLHCFRSLCFNVPVRE